MKITKEDILSAFTHEYEDFKLRLSASEVQALQESAELVSEKLENVLKFIPKCERLKLEVISNHLQSAIIKLNNADTSY